MDYNDIVSGEISLFDYHCNLLLNESLIKSYPVRSLINIIGRKFNVLIDKQEVVISPYNEFNHDIKMPISLMVTFKSEFLKSENNKKELKDILKLYGYNISYVLNNGLTFQLEPKYPIKLNPQDFEINYFYHIYNKKYEHKIKNIGLMPKDSSETNFFHEGGRVYLVYSDSDNVINLKRNLCLDKGLNESDMGICKIEPLPDINYYQDLNAIKRNFICVFVRDNINKYCLTFLNPQTLKFE